MKNEFKSCPFCGNTNIVIITCLNDCCDNEVCDGCSLIQYAVCCDGNNGGCGSHTGYYRNKEKAIEAWNRRVKK